ncbi:C2H2 and C2HC zinc finger [Glarea lozoyensis ATCC 20868]|uniref:C2H2 and C2HC zinc finger n=1 Tax=Glarea lozoyensis (strain ATCC 20868 / MF5171) TaxID=1116229 RepID=S3CPB9_GLAL2|nr:C2H2 and C2HC zinc finger [Glarea lozoyensis ATCC 20868]EPE28292.1 C2H2 and C2HC zinc finger [Glarea lozoyensis ATCC 20868]
MEYTPPTICSCGRDFANLQALEQHTRYWGHSSAWECDPCERIFLSFTAKKSHDGAKHQKSPCPYCRRVFNGETARSFHVESEHAWPCWACKTGFATRKLLGDHLYIVKECRRGRKWDEQQQKILENLASEILRSQQAPSAGVRSNSVSPVDEPVTPATSTERGTFTGSLGTNDTSASSNPSLPQKTNPVVLETAQLPPPWGLTEAEIFGRTSKPGLHVGNSAAASQNNQPLGVVEPKSKPAETENQRRPVTPPRSDQESYKIPQRRDDGQYSLNFESSTTKNEVKDTALLTCGVKDCFTQGLTFYSKHQLETHNSFCHQTLQDIEKKCPKAESSELSSKSTSDSNSSLSQSSTKLYTCDEWSCRNPPCHSQQELDEHTKQKHPVIPKPTVTEQRANVAEEVSKTKDDFFTNVGASRVECPICGEMFSNEDELGAHKKSEHFKFRCQHCNLSFNFKLNFQEHVKTDHPPLQFKCTTCNDVFDSEVKRQDHDRDVHPPPRLGCSKCEKKFVKRSELDLHTVQDHPLPKVQPPKSSQSFGTEASLKKDIPLTRPPPKLNRDECDEVFNDEAERKLHKSRKHAVPEWKCDKCERAFHVKETLEFHQKAFHPPPKFACSECNQVFTDEADLNGHKSQKHPEPKWKCNNCVYAFHVKGDLDVHQKIAHPKPKVKCGKCDKFFDSNAELAKHMVVHTCNEMEEYGSKERAPRPEHKCPHCKTLLASNAELFEHITAEGVHRFSCKEEGCSSWFFTLGLLDAHVNNCHSLL